jgi:tripartite-type tricarboxylate transporter receptor subunit TctC
MFNFVLSSLPLVRQGQLRALAVLTDKRLSLAAPTVKDKLEQGGAVVIGSTPDELASFLRSEMDKWGKVIKESNIQAG